MDVGVIGILIAPLGSFGSGELKKRIETLNAVQSITYKA